MNLILRIVLAILLGVLATGLLDYFGVFSHNINVLIGFIVAILFYFSVPEITNRPL